MLIQEIKRWLQSLFALGPWRRAKRLGYAQATALHSRETTPEPMFRTAVDGPVTQPFQRNTIIISIQPTEEEDIVEWPLFENRERSILPPFSSIPPIPPISPMPSVPPEEIEETFSLHEIYENQQAQQAHTGSRKSQAERVIAESPNEPLEPAILQRLEFLRYLIQHGIVSDDIP